MIGCALIPGKQDRIADAVGLRVSYVIGFEAYAFAAAFSWKYR